MNAIRNFVYWIFTPTQEAYFSDMESYLAASNDIHELEARQRQWDTAHSTRVFA